MADNRTTVKSNIDVLNVPSVSNDDLGVMLKEYLADNLVFKADVSTSQTSTFTNITLDWEDKDRINLTRTGGALNITNSNISDGEVKYLLITKTAGQTVTFVGATDITPVPVNADALATVLYEIVRKGSNYYAKAWVKTVTPATTSNQGVAELASSSEVNLGTAASHIVTPETLAAVTMHITKAIITGGTHTLAAGQGRVYVGTGGSGCTIRLPLPTTVSAYRPLTIINNSGGAISVKKNDGSSFTLDLFGNINNEIKKSYYSDGTNWVCAVLESSALGSDS